MSSPPPLLIDRLRIEVAMVPHHSGYVEAVREATQAAGAEYVRVDFATPTDFAERILVVDLTEVPSIGRLGPQVIAISHRLDLDCYDVVTPDQVRGRLKRVIRNAVERERLRMRIHQQQETIRILNEIGYSLSAQTSRASLLDKVLTHARYILHADGGSIYLVDGDRLRFTCTQNDTIPFRADQFELPIDDGSLAGYVAHRCEPLNIPDVRQIPEDAPYQPNFAFDNETGYSTRSMLLVPMNDWDGNVIGVLALVNRKPLPGVPLASFDQVEPFTEHDEDLARSIASQAAVAIENYRLYNEIRALFDGFVEAAVTAIEARDPSTGGHSHRVAALTTALARAVDATMDEPFAGVTFSERDLTELHYAAILHDFGKVGVREQVLLKADKLYSWELRTIEHRFELARMQVMLESIQGQLDRNQAHNLRRRLEVDLALVRRLNRPSVEPSPEDIVALEQISKRWKLGDMRQPVLEERDIRRLCVARGSLDPDERREIEEHVTHTYNFLKVIPWTRDLRQVPEIAYAHHEKLDGSGYPRGLKGDEIPFGACLMTICDIYDALTASDRAYKAAMPTDHAVRILREEAAEGKLLSDAVELFVARRIWTQVRNRGQARVR